VRPKAFVAQGVMVTCNVTKNEVRMLKKPAA